MKRNRNHRSIDYDDPEWKYPEESKLYPAREFETSKSMKQKARRSRYNRETNTLSLIPE